MPNRTSCAVLVAALFLSLVAPVSAAEFRATYFADVLQTPTPPALLTGTGGSFDSWHVEAGAGYLDIDHTYYSCCNGDIRPSARFRCEDLVFSSPSGGSGTATVRINLYIEGAVAGCTSTTMSVSVGLGGNHNLGAWDGGTEGCHSDQSWGIFAGMAGTSVAGVFSSPDIVVPLDTPVSMDVTLGTRVGSYQVIGTVDARVELVGTESLFTVVDGPADLTANSAEANIVDNRWIDPSVSPVPDFTADRLRVFAAPNPFNPRTRISWSGRSGEATTVEICDVRGRRVETLFEGTATGGTQTVEWTAAGRPSGVYFARVTSGGRQLSEKVLLLK